MRVSETIRRCSTWASCGARMRTSNNEIEELRDKLQRLQNENEDILFSGQEFKASAQQQLNELRD